MNMVVKIISMTNWWLNLYNCRPTEWSCYILDWIQSSESVPFAPWKEMLPQLKIISINNPLVFLNSKKFRTDVMNIIQKEHANYQAVDDISKVRVVVSRSGSLTAGHYKIKLAIHSTIIWWLLISAISDILLFVLFYPHHNSFSSLFIDTFNIYLMEMYARYHSLEKRQ